MPDPSPIEKLPCVHEAFTITSRVARMEDREGLIGNFMLEMRIACTQCGLPFVFGGVPPGLSFTGPRVSIDGTELNIPIEPENEKRLFTSARYEMPPQSVDYKEIN